MNLSNRLDSFLSPESLALIRLVRTEAERLDLPLYIVGGSVRDLLLGRDALVHVLDGEVEVRISGKPYTLKDGEAIIMPANEPHALKALTRFKMLLTMIRK